MGRAPCCSKVGLHKGPWTPREDALLTKYIQAHGEGQWKSLPKKAGLLRCGKSCRLRWMNYLRPDIKRGNITPEEDDLIIRMHSLLGNKWSLIAGRLPGRTDNEIKNYWNTHLSKKVKIPGSDSKYQENEGPSSKKKTTNNNEGKKKSNNNKKQSKKEKNRGIKKGSNNNDDDDGDDDNEEPQKTQVYLPKPIRVKPSCLPRTNSLTTFNTFDSTISGSTTTRSQEKDQEEINNIIIDPLLSAKTTTGTGDDEEEEQNNMIMVNNDDVELENDGFGFFCEDIDLVNNSEMECQTYFATVYEEYLQLLNMEDNMLDLGSFAESLMV